MRHAARPGLAALKGRVRTTCAAGRTAKLGGCAVPAGADLAGRPTSRPEGCPRAAEVCWSVYQLMLFEQSKAGKFLMELNALDRAPTLDVRMAACWGLHSLRSCPCFVPAANLDQP
eukprot:353257-Chlamydomonas_euryale.AAC.5